MNNEEIIHAVGIGDDSDSPGLIPELLNALEWDFSSWFDKIEHHGSHTVYCASADEARERLSLLESLREDWRGLGAEPGALTLLQIKREDWAEVWKKYFHVMEISPRLVVKPSWREYSAKPGQVILEIDPGMSFGTGQHATTSFCLKMIDHVAGNGGKSFLDAGCGSGILSIAAWKLGCRPARAFDIDPDATRVAAENFGLNGIAPDGIGLETADLEGFAAHGESFELVAANILGQVLIAKREIIDTYVKPGGKLILAGILNEEFPAIDQAFTALGYTLEHSLSEKEWTGGMFSKPGR